MIKRIIYISLWTIATLLVIAFEIQALSWHSSKACPKLNVSLNNSNNYPLLITAEELKTRLFRDYSPIERQSLKNIKPKEIEKFIGSITYLSDYNAYLQIDGTVEVETKPRLAVLRVYNQSGQHFYLGSDTVVMPLSPNHNLRLPLASGFLPDLAPKFFNPTPNDILYLPSIYKKLYILAAKIQEDEFLTALIDQIYVTSEQEFEIIPKTGVAYIEFGDIKQASEKLNKLKYFYLNGKEKIDWNLYKAINLKYENQVVCLKK